MERKMDVNYRSTAILLAVLLLSTFSSFGQSLNPKTTTSPSSIKYWEHLPEGYNKAGKPTPVIFFLHGKGERGDGTNESFELVLKHGPLRHVKNNTFGSFNANGQKTSFIILAPQLNKPATYWDPEYVDEFINYALVEYNIDPERIYLTGLSMGGNGTWNYAYSSFNSENKLAAIAPIAGWGNEDKACKIKERNIPAWIFHGEDDKTVLFSKGESMFKALENCPAGLERDYRFSPYRKTGHNSWQKAYSLDHKWNTPNLFEWFLSHKLNKSQSSVLTKTLSLKNNVIAVAGEEELARPEIVYPLPPSLEEISGIAQDDKGVLWAHNDSYNGPYLMKLDSSGKVDELKKVIFASNFDWEDIASDHQGNLYIGDVGNNENIRKKLFLYKINTNDTSQRIKAESISFIYPDQIDFPPVATEMNYDSEAILYYKSSILVFSKNRTSPFNGVVKVYQIPTEPGEHKAELIDSLVLDAGGSMYDSWITAADISPDGKTIALLSHRKIWLIQCFEDKKLSEARITRIMLDSFTQKEALCFSDNETLLIADEKFKKMLGGNLYKLNITSWLSEECD